MRWRKSSYSGTADDDVCIEVGELTPGVGLRDSKDVAGGHLCMSSREFAGLVSALRERAFG
ncbi:DUF397 domain-containing protein [Spirillospora sp. NPDC052269]